MPRPAFARLDGMVTTVPPNCPRPVGFLFPGQGAQHTRMAAGLYRSEPVFADAIDAVFEAMGRHGDVLRSDWLAESPTTPIDHATRSQPLLFAVEYALSRLVSHWGISPSVLLGHSVGELVAAVIAEVFELDDAVRLLLDRVEHVVRAPSGGMVAVAASVSDLEGLLPHGVAVGAVNAPWQTVLAGLDEPLAAATKTLRGRGFTCLRVPSLTAFHSPVLTAAAHRSEQAFAAVRIRPPARPLYSGYTAALLRPSEAVDPGFWARQPVAPVLFWPALDALLAADDFVLLELGPGQGVSRLARRHAAVRTGRSAVVPLLPALPGPSHRDHQAIRAAHAVLLAEGHRLREGP